MMLLQEMMADVGEELFMTQVNERIADLEKQLEVRCVCCHA